jgi:tRNA (guanosine-2'-O-)-methyltransferase
LNRLRNLPGNLHVMTPERSARMDQVIRGRQPGLTVILENVFDPHNLAAVMRTCDAVGIQEVFAITDRIPERKNWGYRSSRSANKWVDLQTFTSRETCLEKVRASYPRILGSNLEGSPSSIYSVSFLDPLALVFGNEKYGISEEMKAACDGFFQVPQVGMIQSLNISVACAVTLYEAYRQKDIAGHYLGQQVSVEEAFALKTKWAGDEGW